MMSLKLFVCDTFVLWYTGSEKKNPVSNPTNKKTEKLKQKNSQIKILNFKIGKSYIYFCKKYFYLQKCILFCLYLSEHQVTFLKSVSSKGK